MSVRCVLLFCMFAVKTIIGLNETDVKFISDVVVSLENCRPVDCITFINTQLKGREEDSLVVRVQRQLSASSSGLWLVRHNRSADSSGLWLVRHNRSADSSTVCSRPLNVITTSDKGLQLLKEAALSSDPTTSTWLLEAPEGLPLRSDVTLRGPVLVWERGTRILSEVYFASQHTPVVSRRFQGWTPGGGFLEGLCGGEDTLEGLTLRSAIFNNPSVAWIGKNHSVEGGFGVEIWKCLGTSLNFKIDWVVVDKELSWGRQLPDKSWTGVMGLIERKEVDIAVNSFSISEERLTVADFSSHFCFFAGKIHMKKPNSYEMGWKKLLSHTQFSVISVTLAGLLLLLSASLAVSSRILITSRNASNETVSLYDSVFLTWSALLCNQGQDGVPRSVTCRLVYLVSCLGGILLLTFYSAKIISVMTAKYNKLPFTSLKGLIKDGSYKLTISRNSNEYFMFANAKSGIYKEMYDTVMSHNPDDMPATTYEGSKMICQDDKIVIIFSNLFSYTTSIPCVFAVVPEVIYQFSQHYLFQKGSPFTGIVSRKLLKLQESGVIKKIIRDNKADNSFETETNDIAVGLTNVAPIFGILGAGLVMAVLLLGVELLVHHLQSEVSENMH